MFYPSKLSYACENVDTLLADADAFLSMPPVQRSLRDDAFRLSGAFRNAPAKLVLRARGRQERGPGPRTCETVAAIVQARLNQTQKARYHEQGDALAVLRISQRMERLGLVLEGSEFVSSYAQEGEPMIFDPPIEDEKSAFRMRFALATTMHLSVTTGDLTSKPDQLVTVTHGLHLGMESGQEQGLAVPWISGATRAEMAQIFQNAFPGTNPIKILKKVEGKCFRDAKMHADAEERRRKCEISLPAMGVQYVTITAEEGGTRNLERGRRPVFFRNANGVGPQDPEGMGIDFHRDNLCAQVIRAMQNGLIAKMIQSSEDRR